MIPLEVVCVRKADCMLKASMFVLVIAVAQWYPSHAWAQNRRSDKNPDRGLSVSKPSQPALPRTGDNNIVPTSSASHKPQLIVQLGGAAESVAYSPDGRFIITGGENALLWDAATGQEIRGFYGHSSGVEEVAFSPDGRFVLTAGSLDKTARIWDVTTGKEIKRLVTPSEVRTVAYSPQGKLVLTGGDAVARLWDVETGREIRRFIGHTSFVESVKFSPDGRFVLTGSLDMTARLWDATTGREIRRILQGPSKHSGIKSVAFSPDGRFILTGGYLDKTARLWDAVTGKAIKDFLNVNWLYSVAFSPDGRSILTAGANNRNEDSSPRLWDMATGQEIRKFTGHSPGGVRAATFSPDGRFVLTGGEDSTIRLWDAATGQEVRRFEGYSSTVNAVAYSPDGRSLLTGNGDDAAHLWNTATGQEIRRFQGHLSGVYSTAYSPDGRYLLTGGGPKDNTARLWDMVTERELRRFSYGDPRFATMASIAYSPDGKSVLTGIEDALGRDHPVVLWDLATGSEIRRFTVHDHSVKSLAYSPDGRFILTGSISFDGTALLLDIATGQVVKRFQVPKSPIAYSTYIAYSPDGKHILTTDKQNARLWDVAAGTEIRRFVASDDISLIKFSPTGQSILTAGNGSLSLWDVGTGKAIIHIRRGPGNWILSAVFSPDGRFILMESGPSAVLLDATTGQELCRLISFKDGRWVVVTPDGRFDTDNLEEIRGLHWILPDDPMRALPAEIFMRDYYEPRLLPRILAGEKFKPITSLSDLNPVQPRVTISSILYQNGVDTVTVSVDVASAAGEFQRGGKKVELKTGVYDLRLFRDGQMVGSDPLTRGEVKTDPATGRAVVTFRNIKLPRKTGITQTEFSAYAFNVDGIKSATDRKAILLDKALTPVKGRAYVITVGVNAYEDSDFDLSFAANDARLVQGIVADRLSKLGTYEDVVQIPLISDYEIRDGKRVVTEKAATKENLKTLLEILSGKRVDPELKKNLPNADKLRRARPEDLVLISFSSHGFADESGNFYFVPYDTGGVNGQEITERLVNRCISSEQLSLWLRSVDAGEMVMIVDACHSAATVNVKGFKAGPMGSRGLGQLAYDKGMRILTSTQADDVALESELIRQGLLTYALTHDGIEAGQADFKPKDNIITLAEWLEYGVTRVPTLYEEVKKGELQDFGRGKEARGLVVGSSKASGSLIKNNPTQQPSLFDFARRKQDVVLVKQN